MRLSEWRAVAPHRDSMTPKVLAVVQPVLAALGGESDPHCWIFWGDDPGMRWLAMAVTPSGLAMVNARVNVPGEGPRAAGRLLRWSRVQVGELQVETGSAGRMILSSQIEGQVIRSLGDDVPAAAAFVAAVLAAIDGRPPPDPDRGSIGRRPVKRSAGRPAASSAATSKAAASKPRATKAAATKGASASGTSAAGRPKRG